MSVVVVVAVVVFVVVAIVIVAAVVVVVATVVVGAVVVVVAAIVDVASIVVVAVVVVVAAIVVVLSWKKKLYLRFFFVFFFWPFWAQIGTVFFSFSTTVFSPFFLGQIAARRKFQLRQRFLSVFFSCGGPFFSRFGFPKLTKKN